LRRQRALDDRDEGRGQLVVRAIGAWQRRVGTHGGQRERTFIPRPPSERMRFESELPPELAEWSARLKVSDRADG